MAINEPPLYAKQQLERMLEADDEVRQYYIEGLLNNGIKKAIANISDVVGLNEYTDEAVEQYKNFGKITGISTGYAGLNQLTKGLRGGEIIILSAKTSVGKTSLATNIGANVAKNNHPVLFITLEMTHVELAKRYIHVTGGLIDGQPTDDYTKIGAMTILQKDERLSWKSIDGLIAKAKKEMNCELVIIDHLHYFSRETKNPNEEIGIITMEFKKASIKYDIPIILIAHTRKTTKGEHAQAEDVRGSSFIVQDADIVLIMNRDTEDPNIVKVQIAKNRNAGIDWNNDEVHFKMNATKMTEIEQW